MDEAEPIPFVLVFCFFLTCPLVEQFAAVGEGAKFVELVMDDGGSPAGVALFGFCLLSSNERFSSKC